MINHHTNCADCVYISRRQLSRGHSARMLLSSVDVSALNNAANATQRRRQF